MNDLCAVSGASVMTAGATVCASSCWQRPGLAWPGLLQLLQLHGHQYSIEYTLAVQIQN